MKIEYSRRFIKELGRAPRKIQVAFRDRPVLFLENKFNPVLNNHSLGGKIKDYRSININGDWRVVYEELEDGSVIFFVMIGTHSQLYK